MSKRLIQEAVKKIMDEGQVPARHYLALMEQLKKRIQDHALVVQHNQKLIDSHNKVGATLESSQRQHLVQLARYDNEVQRLGSIDWTGKEGHTPTKSELLTLMTPLIPPQADEDKIAKNILSQIKVENGKDAIINEKDIVEKVVEYIKKNQSLDISNIRNWQSAKTKLGGRFDMNDQRWHGAGSSSGAATVYSETPVGAINGINTVYTVSNTITTVIGFWINGQFIHPSEYSATGTTITFVTALDASLSGTGFTISFT